MASWSAMPALSGFRYLGGERTLIALPRVSAHNFHSFWSTATGWGTLSIASAAQKTRFTFTVEEGSVPVRRIEIPGSARSDSIAKLGDTTIVHGVQPKEDHVILMPDKEINVNHETPLRIQC
jgi:hypothetical protein